MSGIRTRLGKGGRVVIPAEYRRELRLAEGDQVVLQVVDGQIQLTPLDEAIRRAQALIRKHVPADVSLVDELIADRRAEASRE